MKNSHLLFLVIFVLSGPSCQKDDESKVIEDQFTEQHLIGTWDGAFNQAGFGDFKGLVTITKLKVGEVTATGNYTSPSCSFQWTYNGTSADGKSYLFKESLAGQNTGCASGKVQLKFKDENHLYYSWTGDDNTGGNLASGILTRK
jgi:hypothetical protein